MKLPKGQLEFASGFTLLEVVVAMTIVGLGVVTLLEIFSMGLRLGARSEIRTEAINAGRQIMDEFLVRRDFSEGTEEGNLASGGRWQLRVEPVRQDPEELSLSNEWELREIVVDMTASDAGRERRMELKTMRLVKKPER